MYVSTSAAELAFPAFVSSSSISVSGVCSLGIVNGFEERIDSGMVWPMKASREGWFNFFSIVAMSSSVGPMCRLGRVS